MSDVDQIDQITVEVIRNYLVSAAHEMNRNLMRTSYNTIIYEIRDFGLGIYDRQCRLLAEAPGLAIFTRGNDYGIQKMVEFLGEENFHPGDVVLLNYPFWSSAHTLDVLTVTPIFYEGELLGYTAIKQHWLDVGQKDAGYVLDSTSLYQEGLVMPCLKIYKKGKLDKEIENLLRFNSRMPNRIIGDLNAAISSCRTGERRVEELVDKFGVDTYHATIEAILDHGERVARSRLAELPNGTWSAEDYVDDDGINKDQLVKVRATVTIDDDEMTIDFTGSDPQTEGPINLPYGISLGMAGLIFKGLTTPDLPANAGNFRPLKVIAEEGSVMNAIPPAPTFTIWTGLIASEVVLKAVAAGMPDVAPACSGGDIFSMMGVGIHPKTGKYWLEATNEGVGFGGHAGGDGENGIMHLSEPGCRNNPVEVLETKAPLFLESYGLRQDSGGPGKHRGGLGCTRVYRFTAPSSALTLVKKTKTDPWGMNGGEPGEAGFVVLRPGTEDEEVTGMYYASMGTNEVLSNNSGGGGGWGDPYERDPQKVLADVRNDYVSVESAREDYGVVIDPDALAVDEAATQQLRAAYAG